MKIIPDRKQFMYLATRVGFIILSVGLALVINMLIWTFIRSLVTPLFLMAIVIVAWRYGVKAGVFATILSGLLIDYYFILPEYQLDGNLEDLMRLLIFAIEGYILCWLVDWKTKATEQIRESQEQLQALLMRQNVVLEEERKRIALEIHDELGQSLTGLKMEMHQLNWQIKDENNQLNNSFTSAKIEDLLNTVDDSILSVRRIATELRPPILDDLGLVAAIEWQSQEFQRRTGIICELAANVEHTELNSEFSTAVFRIFQEAMTNIIKHANAQTVTIIFKQMNHELILRVEDDGDGFENNKLSNNNSLGISGMKERARIIDGNLEIFKGTKKGTVILLTAPLQN